MLKITSHELTENATHRANSEEYAYLTHLCGGTSNPNAYSDESSGRQYLGLLDIPTRSLTVLLSVTQFKSSDGYKS